MRGGSDGRLLVYLLSVQAAAQVAGPYFTPYMLRHLHFSYLEYVLLIGTSFFAKVMALPRLGRLAQRYGARRLLWWGGVGIVPVAGLWLVSQSFWFLVAVQLVGGVAWAAYELAMFLLFNEAIHEDERTSVLSTFNFTNAVATAVGSLCGGLLLKVLGESPATYLTLYGLSTVARGATLVLLRRVPAEATAMQAVAAPADVDSNLQPAAEPALALASPSEQQGEPAWSAANAASPALPTIGAAAQRAGAVAVDAMVAPLEGATCA